MIGKKKELAFSYHLSPITYHLFNYLEIYPLCRRAVFLFGEGIGDDDLEDVFSGSHLCANLYSTACGQPLQVRLAAGVKRLHLSREDFFAIAEEAYLSL